MNQQETTVLLSLIHQNEQLVALVGEMRKELHDARARLDLCTGPVIVDTIDTTVPIHCWEGGVLRPDVGLVPDRGQPRADDPGGADADQSAAVRGAGVDGLDGYPGDSSYPVDPGRLYGAGAPGPGDGDHRGDPLPAGGDGAGDGAGRLGDGDDCTAAIRDHCRNRGIVHDWEYCESIYYCRECPDYAPVTPAAPVETRTCSRCGRELPITAFRVRSGVCDDCRARKVPPATTRVCCDCGQEKPLAEFSRKAGSANPGGRRPFCRECGKQHRVTAVRRHHAAKKAAAQHQVAVWRERVGFVTPGNPDETTPEAADA